MDITVLPIITNPNPEESKLHFSKSVHFVFLFSRALHFYLFITHLKVKNQVARTFVVHLALFYVLDSFSFLLYVVFFFFGFIWANDAPYYSCRCALVWYSCSNSVSVFGLSIFVRERNMLCTIYRLFICVTKLYNLNRSSWHRILLGWKHTLKALNCTHEYEYPMWISECRLISFLRSCCEL